MYFSTRPTNLQLINESSIHNWGFVPSIFVSTDKDTWHVGGV